MSNQSNVPPTSPALARFAFTPSPQSKRRSSRPSQNDTKRTTTNTNTNTNTNINSTPLNNNNNNNTPISRRFHRRLHTPLNSPTSYENKNNKNDKRKHDDNVNNEQILISPQHQQISQNNIRIKASPPNTTNTTNTTLPTTTMTSISSNELNISSPPRKRRRRLQEMDGDTVHQICSGQVILDLASAVKELVENSIDAKATKIDIRFKEYGCESIEVVDNGCGITQDNFETLAQKHATSKLNTFEDLEHVSSFGFRGEALSSLCALGDLTVHTRTADSSNGIGTLLQYDSNNKLVARDPQARGEVGTTVILRNLFHRLPVRQRELQRNTRREFQKVLQVLHAYALICTHTRISVINQRTKGNRKRDVILSTNGSGNIRENISAVFGIRQVKSMMAVDETFIVQDMDVRLQGYISRTSPGCGRGTNDRQYFYLNKRPVDLPRVARAVNEIYKTGTVTQYPVYVLSFEVKTDAYDVNVTPNKRKVFLHQESALITSLKGVLTKIFDSNRHTFDVQSSQPVLPASHSIASTLSPHPSRSPRNSNNHPTNTSSISPSSPSLSPLLSSHNNSSSQVDSSPPPSSPLLSSDREKENNAPQDNSYSNSKVNLINNNNNNNNADVNYDNDDNDDEFIFEYNSAENDIEIRPKSPPSVTSSLQLNAPSYSSSSKHLSSKKDNSDNQPCNLLPLQTRNNIDDDSKSAIHPKEIKTKTLKSNKYKVITDQGRKLHTDCGEDLSLDFNSQQILNYLAQKKRSNNRTNKNQLCSSHSTKTKSTPRFTAQMGRESDEQCEQELARIIHKDDFNQMHIVGQFNLGFIITQHHNDLFIVDQHASDEKYNFERLQETTVLTKQPLISPQDLGLTAAEEMTVAENLDVFQANGFDFDIDLNRPPTQRVKLIAICMSKNTTFGENDIHELITQLNENPGQMCRPSKVRSMFATRACRSSIMIGDPLDRKQMSRIIKNLSDLDQPWNCPHGRPTMRHLVDLSLVDLDTCEIDDEMHQIHKFQL